MAVTVRYLGHAAFALEAEGKKVVIDPFLTGNPMAAAKPEDLNPVAILLTHAHADHVGDSVTISKRTGAPVIATFELGSYLAQQGVVSLMILGQHGVTGDLRSDLDISYLADTMMMLRFFEADGEVRKSIAVIKTRTSDHERTIRELRIDGGGIVIGAPIRGFSGILSGTPVLVGTENDQMATVPQRDRAR